MGDVSLQNMPSSSSPPKKCTRCEGEWSGRCFNCTSSSCQYNFMPSSICNNQVINSSDSAASNHCNLQILYGKEQPPSQLVNSQLISDMSSMQFIPTPRVVSSVSDSLQPSKLDWSWCIMFCLCLGGCILFI